MLRPAELLAAMAFCLAAVPVRAMVFPGTDWETRTPEEMSLDRSKLEELTAFVNEKGGGDGCVVYKGYLVWTWGNIHSKGNIASCTKSFTSTVLGLAIEDGLCTLHQKANDFDSSLSGQNASIEFFHFATMTSGYNRSEGPGELWYYNDPAMNKFADALRVVWGQAIQDVLADRIMTPIGATNWSWSGGGTGNSGAFQCDPDGLARFALLFCNRGNWNGQQLIDSTWADQVGVDQVSVPTADGHVMDSYGLNWWCNTNRQNWPNCPEGCFGAFGYGGQHIGWTCPAERVVVAHRGPYKMFNIQSDGFTGEDRMFRTVLAALPAHGTPNEAPAVSAGADQTITLPGGASLDGTATDDGLPGGALATVWSKASGPGAVTFADASAVDTTAGFSEAGSYVLRLTASDGALSASDDVTITVSPEPAVDTDGDGMPDSWEDRYGFDKNDPSDAALDADGDLRTNLQEYQDGTDPLAPDSDGDGLDDGDEASLGTDPADSDSDDDGLSDGDEVNAHETDPLDEDSDGDGMADGWEAANSLDPLVNDASADPDGDGFSNYEEFLARTDPNDPDSTPPVANGGSGISCGAAGATGPRCVLLLLLPCMLIWRPKRDRGDQEYRAFVGTVGAALTGERPRWPERSALRGSPVVEAKGGR